MIKNPNLYKKFKKKLDYNYKPCYLVDKELDKLVSKQDLWKKSLFVVASWTIKFFSDHIPYYMIEDSYWNIYLREKLHINFIK